MKQPQASILVPPVLQTTHLYRTENKRPGRLTLVPYKPEKQLFWDVSVVDALAPSRLSDGSEGNPDVAAADSEERKFDRYRYLIDKRCLLRPLAFEVQGSVGPFTNMFLRHLYNTNNESRAGSSVQLPGYKISKCCVSVGYCR